MKVFFSADYHLDHANIIRYANRPFIKYEDLNKEGNWKSREIKYSRCHQMNQAIIDNHNKMLTDDDVLYHVGDFCFRYKGDARYWEQMLNGKIIHIRGNHDKNNGTNTFITHCIMEFGGIIFYVTHVPPDEKEKGTIQSYLIDLCNVVLCGHIHEKWKWKKIRRKPCINVGVDAWDMQPVSIHSILKLVARINKGKIKNHTAFLSIL